MHEVGITEDLIRTIEDTTKNSKDVKQVKKVYIRLGKSMGLTEDILKFWFQQLSRGTKLEGATLESSLVDGKEIVVDSIEVE